MTVVKNHSRDDLLVVDADTHLTEPWDLWTSRAPSKFGDRVPRVQKVDGNDTWVFDGTELGPALAGGCVGKDGRKVHGVAEMFSMRVEGGHAGATQIAPRLQLMDELGIWAHLVYPNTVGFGGQKFMECKDEELRTLVVSIFNDAMAEIQEASGQRLFPMGLLPWWNVDASLKELERIQTLGLKGINTSTDPQDHGFEDLGTPLWDPLWAAAAEARLPVNFHIGASFNAMTFYGNSSWPSLHDDLKMGLGSCMMFLLNARVMGNFIYSGILERHPTLKIVSVESGIGWIPFMLEALDYQLLEADPKRTKHLSMMPSEYFKRQIYSCFWFEEVNVLADIERVGIDNCLFETDFPHPTCLYPDSLPRALNALSDLDEAVKRKVMGENAIRLYSLPTP
jgi:uncharacterized protein